MNWFPIEKLSQVLPLFKVKDMGRGREGMGAEEKEGRWEEKGRKGRREG